MQNYANLDPEMIIMIIRFVYNTSLKYDVKDVTRKDANISNVRMIDIQHDHKWEILI